MSFSYPGTDRPGGDEPEPAVAPGETVALVGATGAGKSTVVKLVARFYDPTAGAVLVDGVDLRDYDPSAFRQRLGVVPQEAHLFSGDVASNVGYGAARGTATRSDRGTARWPRSRRRSARWARCRWWPTCRPASASRWANAARACPPASAS